MNSISILIKLNKIYNSIIVDLQKSGTYVCKFDKGYYYKSNDPILQKIESIFIAHVPKLTPELLKKLCKSRGEKDVSVLLHLLGWSQEYVNTPKILIKYARNRSTATANAALRSLFPMIASNYTVVNVRKDLIMLLYGNNKYVLNKTMGILSVINTNILRMNLKKTDIQRLRKLVESPYEIVSAPARIVLKKMGH